MSVEPRPLTVLHVVTGLGTGGAEMMLCQLVESAATTRHRVIALMPGGRLAERLRRAGIPLDELAFRQGRPSLTGTIRLAGLIRRHRPDLLQGWMYHGNMAATFAQLGTRRRPPLLWGIHHSLHDPGREKPLTRALIALGRRLSRRTAGIVYCSGVSARQHEARGYPAARTVVIPNGIDCEQFRPVEGAGERLRRTLGVAPGATVVGMVARYHPMKDHANLIRAAGMLAERRPLHLVLVGQGVDGANAELVAAIRAAGLAGRVSLLGERDDVQALMPGFDTLVLPSAWGEAFPLVLCEAMASGVPCIATDVGDSRWIIGDTGMVVPRQDAPALAAALEHLAGLEAGDRRRLGQRARSRIGDNFSLQEVVRRYEDLYRERVEPATPAP